MRGGVIGHAIRRDNNRRVRLGYGVNHRARAVIVVTCRVCEDPGIGVSASVRMRGARQVQIALVHRAHTAHRTRCRMRGGVIGHAVWGHSNRRICLVDDARSTGNRGHGVIRTTVAVVDGVGGYGQGFAGTSVRVVVGL